MKKTLLIVAGAIGALLPKVSLAHCPLCTAGAGALAIFAASIGVSSAVIGVLIGAFALALSLWIAEKWPKKIYFPYQKTAIGAVIFLGTIIPIMPLIREYTPLYVPFIGEYGTTYALNLYLFGAFFGALAVLAAPYLSRIISRLCGKTMPYQGVVLTLLLLVLVSLIIQFSI
jgi:hypothetical protein